LSQSSASFPRLLSVEHTYDGVGEQTCLAVEAEV
jgi:hypothetical protein